MTRRKTGRILAGVAAAGFFATAWLHGTGYDSVTQLAGTGPRELESLVPALWLSFSFDLVVLGLIVAAVAWRPSTSSRAVLAIAALAPLAGAGLQLRFIGFVPPTAILIALGGLTLAAAAALGRKGTKTWR